MNALWIEIALGFFSTGFALYTIWLRFRAPEKFSKLDAMKRVYGKRAGVIVHVIFYTLIPLAFGIYLLFSGITGKNVF